jgi:hypothetical protein
VAAGLAQLKFEKDVTVGRGIAGRVGHPGPHVEIVHGEATATDIELATGTCIVRDTVVQGKPSPLPEVSPFGRGRLHEQEQPDGSEDRFTGWIRGAPDRRRVARYAGAAVSLPAPNRASSGSRLANSPQVIVGGDPAFDMSYLPLVRF